jgi:multicomponent Na+:H+ antiporter subunit G
MMSLMLQLSLLEWVSALFIFAGLFFFIGGTVGLLRFPDVYMRLHAMTKADNLGLGLTVTGLIMQAESFPLALKLILIWVFVLVGGTTACHLVARAALRGGIQPWMRRD